MGLQEDLATKHVANIGYALKRFSAGIDRDMESVEKDLKKLSQMSVQSLQKIEDQRKRELEHWKELGEVGRQNRPSQLLKAATKDTMNAGSDGSHNVKRMINRQNSRGSRITSSFTGGVAWLRGSRVSSSTRSVYAER